MAATSIDPYGKENRMLTHPTLDQLNQLGLLGMTGAFGDMIEADTANLSHAEWLALPLEREISHHHDKRLAPGCATPSCDIRRRWGMSITALSAVWTGLSSRSWRLNRRP